MRDLPAVICRNSLLMQGQQSYCHRMVCSHPVQHVSTCARFKNSNPRIDNASAEAVQIELWLATDGRRDGAMIATAVLAIR